MFAFRDAGVGGGVGVEFAEVGRIRSSPANIVLPSSVSGFTLVVVLVSDDRGNDDRLMSLQNGGSTKAGLLIGRTSTKAGAFVRNSSDELKELASVNTTTKGELTSILLTVRDGDARLYLNGELEATEADTDLTETLNYGTDDVLIGGVSGVDTFSMDGQLLWAGIFDTVLPSTLIRRLHRRPYDLFRMAPFRSVKAAAVGGSGVAAILQQMQRN